MAKGQLLNLPGLKNSMMKRNVILLVEDDELDVISVERSLKKLDEE